MPTYRAYRVDNRHRILNGTWLEASNDAAAVSQAEELCDESAPTVELWESKRLVEEIDCEEDGDCDCGA
jgi:hypothetical protein